MKFSEENGTDTNLVNNTETVIAGPVYMYVGTGDPIVTLDGTCQVTTDAAATGLTLRIRRGADETGDLVSEENAESLEAAAGGTEGHELSADDGPGLSGSVPYVLTAERAGAAGTSVCLYAHLVAQRG